MDLRVNNGFGLVGNGLSDGEAVIAAQKFIVGPCKILVAPNRPSVPWPNRGRDDEVSDFGDFKFFYDFSYRITKPSAAGTTTSAPILLPPTQDAAKSWFVKLQVSSDLKAWDDVAPGQFLGSDTARFWDLVMGGEGIAIGAKGARDVENLGVTKALLHAVADRVVVILGFDDCDWNSGFPL